MEVFALIGVLIVVGCIRNAWLERKQAREAGLLTNADSR